MVEVCTFQPRDLTSKDSEEKNIYLTKVMCRLYYYSLQKNSLLSSQKLFHEEISLMKRL